MKNIHIVPTDKPSRLHIAKNGDYHYSYEDVLHLVSANDKPHNIYITSDEALPYDSSIFDSGAFYHRDPVGDVYIITKDTFKPNPHFCKRIILTTDQDLIKDGIQVIDDEFLEWFINNPSCEVIEVNIDYSKSVANYSYKIIIPKEESKQHLIDMMKDDEELGLYEEPKQETLEEAAKKYSDDWEEITGLDYDEQVPNFVNKLDFINGAKWQQERSYSENEVLQLLLRLQQTESYDNLYEWFEQFKKK
jgi:hypothetical protein